MLTEASPYVGSCGTITPVYEQLVGLRVGPGFGAHLRRLFALTRGCTHMSELVGTMATGVMQTLAGEFLGVREQKPFQLDRCHALHSSGAVVARHYPTWYRRAAPTADPEPDTVT